MTGIPAQKIVLKRRAQTGKRQYEKQSTEKVFMPVREGQVQLLVNLKDYLDTGLFLDHRPTRLEIASLGQGQTLPEFILLYRQRQCACGGRRCPLHQRRYVAHLPELGPGQFQPECAEPG